MNIDCPSGAGGVEQLTPKMLLLWLEYGLQPNCKQEVSGEQKPPHYVVTGSALKKVLGLDQETRVTPTWLLWI